MQTSQPINPKIINTLAKQQAELARDAPDGVIFYQNEEGDVTDIQADIIGPYDTPFAGGVFRCKLVIDNEFPQKPPKGYFLTKIFHPNVAQPSGDICVNTLKRDWNPQKWSLSHIFQIIKCLLIVPFPESALNEEAGRLFISSYEDFSNQARLYTQIHAKPNAKQVQLIEEMEQKQKIKKISKAKNMDGMSEAQSSPSKSEMPLPGLQKTFSLGQATQQQKQSLPQSTTNFGVLGLSQVTNSMAPMSGPFGFSEPGNNPHSLDTFNKTEEKSQVMNGVIGTGGSNVFGAASQFGAVNSGFGFPPAGGENTNNMKFGSAQGGSQDARVQNTTDTAGQTGGLGAGFGGFGSAQDIGFGMSMGLGIGLGNQVSGSSSSQGGGNSFLANGMQEQSAGFQDSQNSLSTMQSMNMGMAQSMGTGGMISTQKNKKKIGGKCRI